MSHHIRMGEDTDALRSARDSASVSEKEEHPGAGPQRAASSLQLTLRKMEPGRGVRKKLRREIKRKT